MTDILQQLQDIQEGSIVADVLEIKRLADEMADKPKGQGDE